MGEETLETKENKTRMFVDGEGNLTVDEQLALHIVHKFNIDCDTLDCMPAFNQHKKALFENKEK